jgi:hypothetical protein
MEPQRVRWNGLKGKQYVLDTNAVLVVLPWSASVEKPDIVIDGSYHEVRTGVQPRITKCYNRSYTYSGRKHPVEKTTPDNIQAIMDFTVEMYTTKDKPDTIKSSFKNGVPMCLVNFYPSCRHNIGRHSDDEKQFSSDIPDVICWVLGGENRRLIIRNMDAEIVLSLCLTNCIYVMSGSKFQINYTHEIPQEYAALFNKMSEKAPEDLTTLLKADWLLAYPKVGMRYTGWDEWATPRTSFTVRFFAK